MTKKINAQKILIETIKDFISKNRCSIPIDDVITLEICVKQFENECSKNQSFENRNLMFRLLNKAIEILLKYFLFKEIHDFFED